MIPHRTTTGFAATVFLTTAFVALAAAAVGCGGGSSTTTTNSGPVAVFTPDPAAGTIALLPGSSSGASVNVRVTVTGVNSFFGAAFRIKYDTTALQFNGMDDSGSFLRLGVADPNQLSFLQDSTHQPGQIVITATRFFPALPVDVAATADLVVLNFVARKAIAATAPARLDFILPSLQPPVVREVYDGTVTASGPGTIDVTWSGGGVSTE